MFARVAEVPTADRAVGSSATIDVTAVRTAWSGTTSSPDQAPTGGGVPVAADASPVIMMGSEGTIEAYAKAVR
ncbi:hypothetical protein [Actinoplanes couchii]|uniref:Uncharacterized protein n=1 Tax=Actinoplanes couchii TaxID=403638 RepID=A0ABQ3XKY5_9ACTN|nr:hypothetical protein [Actinoplanes couchii]MDR6319504.1 hypothetical protein [Actinoplanes couchii]GID59107.1 hypothetical protein Aco03nite_075110 [Actinoplanes couchii]